MTISQKLILGSVDSEEPCSATLRIVTSEKASQSVPPSDGAILTREELEAIVADRTQHLEEAQQESERLLTAIDSLLIGLDNNGVVQRWNQNAAQVFGIDEQNALGRRLADLPIDWEDAEGTLRFFETTNQVDSTGHEAIFRDQSDEPHHLTIACYPIRDADQIQGVLILGMDTTERFIMEQQLVQAQKLESVGQLAAGVAHEINTPMQYVGDNLEYLSTKFDRIINFVQKSVELIEVAAASDFQPELVNELQSTAKKLRLHKLYEQIPEALKDSIDGVGHVSRIVRAMKELSHPGREEKSSVCINHVLETTITVSTNEWKYAAEIETDFQADLPMVSGFSGELNQVFLNLIVNAAHAISDVTQGGNKGKGRIRISSQRTGETVLVEIKDTGGGIPEKIRDRVFDPFFTTKEVGKGTGQGLAIAHAVIVQKHGGRVWFDVDEGVGTTFFIELPIASDSPIDRIASSDSSHTN